jgi:hypothetical protein
MIGAVVIMVEVAAPELDAETEVIIEEEPEDMMEDPAAPEVVMLKEGDCA